MAAEKVSDTRTYTITIPDARHLQGFLRGPRGKDVEIVETKNKDLITGLSIQVGTFNVTCSRDFLAGMLIIINVYAHEAEILNEGRSDKVMSQLLREYSLAEFPELKSAPWVLCITNPEYYDRDAYGAKTRDVIDGYRYFNTKFLGNPDCRRIVATEREPEDVFIHKILHHEVKVDPNDLYGDWVEDTVEH